MQSKFETRIERLKLYLASVVENIVYVGTTHENPAFRHQSRWHQNGKEPRHNTYDLTLDNLSLVNLSYMFKFLWFSLAQ